MFVNKIGVRNNSTNFKGSRYVTDENGKTVRKYSIAYDYNKGNTVYKEFFIADRTEDGKGFTVRKNDNPQRIKVDIEGTEADPIELLGIKEGSAFASRNAEYSPDGRLLRTWVEPGPKAWDSEGNVYNIERTNVTKSKGHTQSMYVMPDATYPEYKIYGFNSDKTGEIYVDKSIVEKNLFSERAYSNMSGGNFAGVRKALREYAAMGIDVAGMSPINNGGIFSHGYSNINNNSIDLSKGTPEDFAALVCDGFVNGVKLMYDATLTSENLMGVNFQTMLQSFYEAGVKDLDNAAIPDQFFMYNALPLLDMPFCYGVIPENGKEFTKVRYINFPYRYNKDKNIIEDNPSFNPNKPTEWQVYDTRRVAPSQLEDQTKLIENYDVIDIENVLDGKSFDQTSYPYHAEMSMSDSEEIKANMERNLKKNIPYDSIENLSTSTFSVGTVTKGVDDWDHNNDLPRSYNVIPAPIEQRLRAEKDQDVADNIRRKFRVGTKRSFDMKLESIRYNLQKPIDIVMLNYAKYAAQITSRKELLNQIAQKHMSPKVDFTDEQIRAIRAGDEWEKETPWGKYDRNDTTVKALMKYPLGSLQGFHKNTLGILISPYLASMGVDKETIKKTRFELMQMGNPHVDSEHSRTYHSLNNFYYNELRLLTDKVIDELNKKLPEKLIDEDGTYTQYGEYIVNLIAPEIFEFAFYKSLAKDVCEVKVLKNGDITYNYAEMMNNTSLQQLGINEKTQKAKATAILSKLREVNLNTEENINLLTDAFMKKLDGTTVEGFRMMDAILKEVPLQFMRLDAIKETVDWDAVRALIASYDVTIDKLVEIINDIMDVIKSVDKNIAVVPEFTDFQMLLDHIGGSRFNNQDEVIKYILNETGLLSEMGYAWFYENLYKGDISTLSSTFDNLINNYDQHYIRNLVSFVDNHDKPRLTSLYALNMHMFRAGEVKRSDYRHEDYRYVREEGMKITQKVDNLEDLPLELRLNIDNPEYFRTINTRALAMSSHIRKSINDAGINLSKDEKDLIYQAIADMTDGHYLQYGETLNRTQISKEKLPEIYDLQGAVSKVLELSGISDDGLLSHIVERAGSNDKINYHLVVDEYYPDKLGYLLNGAGKASKEDCETCSPYVTSIASLILDIVNNHTDADDRTKTAIRNGLKTYVRQFNRAYVDERSDLMKLFDSDRHEKIKQEYGARDIEHNIHSIVDHAIYLAKKQGKNVERFNDPKLREELEVKILRKALTPAINKTAAIMEFSAVLPGLSTLYYGDNMGMTGFEDECRNPNLQNRNPMFSIENMPEGPRKEWHKEVMAKFEKGMQIRSALGVDAVNDGCFYKLIAETNESQGIYNYYDKLRKTNVFTHLAHSDRGSVISILNYNGLHDENPSPRMAELSYIAFPKDSNISLPVETLLYNALNPDDTRTFIIQYNNEAQEYRLYNEEYGEPIRIDGWTLVLTTENVKEKLGQIEAKAEEYVEETKSKSFDKKDLTKVIPALLLAASVAVAKRKVGGKYLKGIEKKLNRLA